MTMAGNSDELTARLELAVEVAGAAGRLIMGYFQAADLTVERKRDASPVTAADREAEELIRERIGERFPGDGFLGEEYGEQPGGSGYRWIIDPVDGTKSFIHGVPLFGTLIGLEDEGRMVAGVCRMPALDEVVYAATGQGAWWQRGRNPPGRATVSTVAPLGEALFSTTTITGWRTTGRQDVFDRLCAAAGLVRGFSDCYGHLLVATGRADLMVDPEMNNWDAGALLPILEEAGGHFVDFDGHATIDGGCGLSVNAALKDEVLAVIAG